MLSAENFTQSNKHYIQFWLIIVTYNHQTWFTDSVLHGFKQYGTILWSFQSNYFLTFYVNSNI